MPTPRKDQTAKILQDILLFDRIDRLKYHFFYNPDQPNSETSLDTDSEPPHNTILHLSSG